MSAEEATAAVGTFETSSNVRFRSLLEAKRTCRKHRGTDVHDPNVWSGRALQEVFLDPADAVSH
jgi:hypothetical protein